MRGGSDTGFGLDQDPVNLSASGGRTRSRGKRREAASLGPSW